LDLDFGFWIEAFEKSSLSSTRRQIPVILERSEESDADARPFFGWKRLGMKRRSFAALKDDECFLAVNKAGEVSRRPLFAFFASSASFATPRSFEK